MSAENVRADINAAIQRIEVNEYGLKFMARLVDAVVQLRQEVGRTYTMLNMGGWEGYDYADKFDQLLEEAGAFGEVSDG
jgi:hypothetical protein